jgi:hypothetical protein
VHYCKWKKSLLFLSPLQQTNPPYNPLGRGIPTAKPNPEPGLEAEYSNEQHCTAVQGQSTHAHYMHRPIIATWWRNKFLNPLLNFHSKTRLTINQKFPATVSSDVSASWTEMSIKFLSTMIKRERAVIGLPLHAIQFNFNFILIQGLITEFYIIQLIIILF